MRVILSNVTVETTTIRKLHNKYKRIMAKTKIIRPHYCIEFIDGTFMVIDKHEYKLLKRLMKLNND